VFTVASIMINRVRWSIIALSLQIAIASLRANPLRSMLATLGVIIGVASLVVVLSLGDGMERYARERIEQQGYQTVTVRTIETDNLDGVSIPRKQLIHLQAADVPSLARRLPRGSSVQLSRQGVTTITLAGDTMQRGTRVVGILDGHAQARFAIVRGRLFGDDKRDEVVISDSLAAKLRSRHGLPDILGAEVRFAGGPRARVVGVIRGVDAPIGNVTVTSFDQAAAIVLESGGSAGLPVLEVHAGGIEDVATVRSIVRSWVTERFREGGAAFAVSSLGRERLLELRRGIRLFQLFSGMIVGISLVVGGIGIMNVLLTGVTERMREIGIRKASGATRAAVLQQFLAESVVITATGGALGVLWGLGISFLLAGILRSATHAMVYAAFDAVSLLIASSAAILIGLVFGTYPAWLAARLSPMEAIRHEV
jgi:putative ABC transport system permease protein